MKELRKAKTYIKGDERISGDGDFVNVVLAGAQEEYDRRDRLASMGVTVDGVAARVAELMNPPLERIWRPGKERMLVQARSLLCFWAVRELGVSMTSLARKLGVSCTPVSLSITRGEQIAQQNDYKLIANFKT